MTHQYGSNDMQLLRAIEMDAKNLGELLLALARKRGVGIVVAEAMNSVEALAFLIDAIAFELTEIQNGGSPG